MAALLFPCLSLLGQSSTKEAAAAARAWRVKHEIEIVDEFTGLLSRPNLASDEAGIQANANAVKALLEQRGIKSRLVETPGAPPVIYGEWPVPGATRTVVFYAHYDGQPLNPKDWVTRPWDSVLRDGPLESGAKIVSVPKQGDVAGIHGEWRLYARSASDDKAPIIALLTAIDALRNASIPLRQNVKFVFEGEEEAGSQHFEEHAGLRQGCVPSGCLAYLRWPRASDPTSANCLLERAACSTWNLRFLALDTNCTAGTTVIGFRIRP